MLSSSFEGSLEAKSQNRADQNAGTMQNGICMGKVTFKLEADQASSFSPSRRI